MVRTNFFKASLAVLTSAKAITVSSEPHNARFGSFTHSRRATVNTAQQKKKIAILVNAGAVLPEAAGMVESSDAASSGSRSPVRLSCEVVLDAEPADAASSRVGRA